MTGAADAPVRARAGHLALTFDDGPDPDSTPALLDALGAEDARATFFVLGTCAASHPDLIRRAVAEGHTVHVHAYDHVRHTALDRAGGLADLDRALAVLDRLGVRPTLWRTPWGVEADWTRSVAAEHGLRITGWTVDTHDWRGGNAHAMLSAISPEIQSGSVVLAHDGLGPGAAREGCAETVALVAPLVALARFRGLRTEALS